MKSKFKKDYSYDKNLQEKIFTKREFYFNKVPQRSIFNVNILIYMKSNLDNFSTK